MLINHNHAICIYSHFGLGKTALVGKLVEALLAGTSYKARLVTAENTRSIQSLIDSGLIEVWRVNNRNYPFETLRAAADGAWPVDPMDPASLLVAPTNETFEKYPIRIFEGMATLSNYIGGSTVEGSLANRIGDGERIGPTDSGELIRFQDGQEGIGMISRSNYGMIQKEMTSIIQRSQKRPGYTIWTSHEDDVKEKRGGIATGRTIVGPEVFGGALTTTIGREFADVWHIVAEKMEVEDTSGNVRVLVDRKLYVKEHVAEGMLAKATHSAGVDRDSSVPDAFAMSKNGQAMLDIAERVLAKIPLGRKGN